MNNCPKCGNPIQNGTPSCPICGTQFIAPQPFNNQLYNNAVPQQVGQNQQAPINNINQTSQQPQINQSVPQKITRPEPITPKNINEQTTTIDQSVQNKPASKKIKVNKKVLILLLAIIVVGSGLFIYLNSGTKTKKSNTNTQTSTVEYMEVATNGFKFKIEKEWYVKEGNGVVLVKDSKSRVLIKLEKYNNSFSDYSKQKIEEYLNNNRTDLKDIKVSELEIEAKPVIMVEAIVKENNNEEKTAQYYYVKYGDNMIIGATVIYLDENSKADIEGSITTVISSLNYYDETSAVLKDVSEYINTFGVYGNVISSVNKAIIGPQEQPQIVIENNQEQSEQNNLNTQENQQTTP